MPTRPLLLFDKPGPTNTSAVLEAVRARVAELGIRHVVVASSTGGTALRFADALKDAGAAVVCVTAHAGFNGGDSVALEPDKRKALEARGVPIVMCAHALSGVGRSISNKFGGVTPVEIIAHTLRRFGEGVKVAVEIAVMAADAGAIPTDKDVIAVGGSGKGADTALVLKAAHMNNFFDLQVREVIALARRTH
ncbi:MAG: hypothetical protein FJ279_14565 [Planctomycetes bacterium]|nr:hypothetical protein [Planctomycetota bacterium]MBM4080927.1 hypothetical protein [Planctomycetota bacterium]MBM4087304.1 hypothetical protein [Planctomycetota bacterium]